MRSMRGRKWLALSTAAAVVMVVFVVTAPNSYPTPTDSLWGHVMPTTEVWIDLVLVALSAAFAGVAVARNVVKWKVRSAMSVALASAISLYLLSVLAWRPHAPASGGNGG